MFNGTSGLLSPHSFLLQVGVPDFHFSPTERLPFDSTMSNWTFTLPHNQDLDKLFIYSLSFYFTWLVHLVAHFYTRFVSLVDHEYPLTRSIQTPCLCSSHKVIDNDVLFCSIWITDFHYWQNREVKTFYWSESIFQDEVHYDRPTAVHLPTDPTL